MVTRQPHHEDAHEDDENRTVVDQEGPAGPCGDVAAYVLGVLDPAQHVIFSRHLAGCEDCRSDSADFGMFAPVLRPALTESPPGTREPCSVARSILLVAAGVVVAIAAVLSVVGSLASHADNPVDVGTLTRAETVHTERFPPTWQM